MNARENSVVISISAKKFAEFEAEVIEIIDTYRAELDAARNREIIALGNKVADDASYLLLLPVELWHDCILPQLTIRQVLKLRQLCRYAERYLIDFNRISFSKEQCTSMVKLPNVPLGIAYRVGLIDPRILVAANQRTLRHRDLDYLLDLLDGACYKPTSQRVFDVNLFARRAIWSENLPLLRLLFNPRYSRNPLFSVYFAKQWSLHLWDAIVVSVHRDYVAGVHLLLAPFLMDAYPKMKWSTDPMSNDMRLTVRQFRLTKPTRLWELFFLAVRLNAIHCTRYLLDNCSKYLEWRLFGIVTRDNFGVGFNVVIGEAAIRGTAAIAKAIMVTIHASFQRGKIIPSEICSDAACSFQILSCLYGKEEVYSTSRNFSAQTATLWKLFKELIRHYEETMFSEIVGFILKQGYTLQDIGKFLVQKMFGGPWIIDPYVPNIYKWPTCVGIPRSAKKRLLLCNAMEIDMLRPMLMPPIIADVRRLISSGSYFPLRDVFTDILNYKYPNVLSTDDILLALSKPFYRIFVYPNTVRYDYDMAFKLCRNVYIVPGELATIGTETRNLINEIMILCLVVNHTKEEDVILPADRKTELIRVLSLIPPGPALLRAKGFRTQPQ